MDLVDDLNFENRLDIKCTIVLPHHYARVPEDFGAINDYLIVLYDNMIHAVKFVLRKSLHIINLSFQYALPFQKGVCRNHT